MIKTHEELKEACQNCPLYDPDIEVTEKHYAGQGTADFDVAVVCGRRRDCDLLERKFLKSN